MTNDKSITLRTIKIRTLVPALIICVKVGTNLTPKLIFSSLTFFTYSENLRPVIHKFKSLMKRHDFYVQKEIFYDRCGDPMR